MAMINCEQEMEFCMGESFLCGRIVQGKVRVICGLSGARLALTSEVSVPRSIHGYVGKQCIQKSFL